MANGIPWSVRIQKGGKADGFEHCDKCGLPYGNNVPHIRFPLGELAPYVPRPEPQRPIRTLPLFNAAARPSFPTD